MSVSGVDFEAGMKLNILPLLRRDSGSLSRVLLKSLRSQESWREWQNRDARSNISAHANSDPASSLRSLSHAELKFRKRIARILTLASALSPRYVPKIVELAKRNFKRGITLVSNCRLIVQDSGILARTDCLQSYSKTS